MASSNIIFSRNTSKDIIPQPSTLYTNSTTLTTGMTLYNNIGMDTKYKVGEISGDSFDIVKSITTRTITAHSTVADICDITINNITCKPSDYSPSPESIFVWTINVGDSVTMTIDAHSERGNVFESSNTDYIPNFGWRVSNPSPITFVMPDEDLSFYVDDELD